MNDLLELPTKAKKPVAVKKMVIPEHVIVIPRMPKEFRLGLEKTKENFVRVPGVNYRWAPDKVGDTYKTGLQYISVAKKKELESAIGKTLNDAFYANITYIMDGSNPNGHHMDLTDPFEMVVFLAFIDSSLVATSKSQIDQGIKPFAEWYIQNDEDEAETLAAQIDENVHVIETYKTLSDLKKRSYCKLMGINAHNLSPKIASTKLWSAITANGKQGQLAIKRFLEITKWSDEQIAVTEEVEDAIAANILRQNTAHDWLYGSEFIGSAKDQVVSKLMSGEGNGLRIAIKNQLLLHR